MTNYPMKKWIISSFSFLTFVSFVFFVVTFFLYHNPFDGRFGVMTKIDQQTQSKARGLKVIEYLRAVLVANDFHRL